MFSTCLNHLSRFTQVQVLYFSLITCPGQDGIHSLHLTVYNSRTRMLGKEISHCRVRDTSCRHSSVFLPPCVPPSHEAFFLFCHRSFFFSLPRCRPRLLSSFFHCVSSFFLPFSLPLFYRQRSMQFSELKRKREKLAS